MKVEGKTAVVTGGASGIGAAIVRALISRNCTVIIADYEKEKAEALASELGGKASALQFDAADVKSVAALAEQTWSQTGGVDLVFANAGINLTGPLLQATPEQFDWIFAVNTRGAWATCKEFGSRMIENGREGHLVITGSEHSLGMQHSGAGFYTATKTALLGIADVMRDELPGTVGISLLCPGLTSTELYDADRFGVLPEGPAGAKDLGAKIMGKGMSAADVAEAAIAGVERGDFYIVTHAISYPPAEKRYEEIKAAFAAQAPLKKDSEKYSVPRVVSETLTELQGSKS